MKLIVYIMMLLLVTSCEADTHTNKKVYKNEIAIDFIKRYVSQKNNISPESFSSFWYANARKYIHDTPQGLQKEMVQARGIHEIILHDETLTTTPEINNWGDSKETISYTYTLNNPSYFPVKENIAWTQYQITIEKEDGKWVVSGESFIR